MYTNVNIISSAISHPKMKVNNSYYIEHFNKLNNPIDGLLKHLGREERYIIDSEEENVITMAVEAGEKAIKNAKLKKEDIDMIVFISDTPEYTQPTNALIVHNKMGLKADLAFDMNNNCIGMLTAIDLISNYLKSNGDISNALLVGGQNVSFFAREDDPIAFATSGDAAAAIILEKKVEDIKRGFIDSAYHTDSSLQHKMRFPGCGMSKILKEDVPISDKKLMFMPQETNYFSDEWKKLILKVLNRNNIEVEEVKQFFFSQFSLADIKRTIEKLNVEEDKYTFVGSRFGYTGCTSPIFAYHFAVKNNKIKTNDYVIFCSVGIGYSMNVILHKM
jgi:3-oxoacyl-[acyl-carrier-protein] synthase III